MEKSSRTTALTVTFCGMMVALGAAFMIVGGFFGVLTYAAPLIASVCLIPVKREFGAGRAWLAWLATAILSVLVSADKEEAFFYVFFGFYPIVRTVFMRIKPRLPRILAKLAFFAAAIGAMYALLCFAVKAEQVIADLSELGTALKILFFAGLVLIMLIYDFIVKYAELTYVKRIRPKLKFLKQ